MMRKIKGFGVIISVLIIFQCISFLSCSKDEKSGIKLNENWNTDSARYYKSGKLINGSKGDNIVFSEDDNGGITVRADQGSGYVPLSLVSCKKKTALDGLTVEIIPENMDFSLDSNARSQVISVMWTQDPIQSIEESLTHYDYTATNGIRNSAQPTKGLCITLNNSYSENDGTKIASNLMITLIDGDFHDAVDGRLGYRWSFTARNFLSQSSYSDDTKIVSKYADIDISSGLKIAVRKDTEHGYIVNVNGIDYYSADNIAYYPNNVSDQYSEQSMTYKKNDIDLTSLLNVEDGYLSIGVCGTLREPGLTYSYKITEINGTPAAYWNGK